MRKNELLSIINLKNRCLEEAFMNLSAKISIEMHFVILFMIMYVKAFSITKV